MCPPLLAASQRPKAPAFSKTSKSLHPPYSIGTVTMTTCVVDPPPNRRPVLAPTSRSAPRTNCGVDGGAPACQSVNAWTVSPHLYTVLRGQYRSLRVTLAYAALVPALARTRLRCHIAPTQPRFPSPQAQPTPLATAPANPSSPVFCARYPPMPTRIPNTRLHL